MGEAADDQDRLTGPAAGAVPGRPGEGVEDPVAGTAPEM
jgi:hypothetical protein